ncbi:MAG: succinate dehydrogenase, partial [Clostridia bacterium]|nr:succinate dehydrogenase [Clostridia bacterium]NLW24079.1 succinate dehydrogenase [Clostridia bacterium]
MNFFEKHYFLLRKLHVITGVLPVGVFLLVHLTINSYA